MTTTDGFQPTLSRIQILRWSLLYVVDINTKQTSSFFHLYTPAFQTMGMKKYPNEFFSAITAFLHGMGTLENRFGRSLTDYIGH